MAKYKVQQGEKLSVIAARFGVGHHAFLEANRHRETTVLPSGETVFRSLSTGDELNLPSSLSHLPVDEPCALGAPGDVAPRRSTAPAAPVRRPPPKISHKASSSTTSQYGKVIGPTAEQKHALALANSTLAAIDQPIGVQTGYDAKRSARWAYYQNIQRRLVELTTYSNLHVSRIARFAEVKSAITALSQQVDVYGTLVWNNGTEMQIADAYHSMRAAALALLATLS